MDKIEKIRQEIERRKVQYYEREMKAWEDNGEYGDEDCYFYQGKRKACEGLLAFLDTLSEEPDKSLEEAADKYARLDSDDKCVWKDGGKYKGFIAGAEWQEEQDTRDMFMSDNRHFNKVYELGKKDMKEQMMKDAVEGYVTFNYDAQEEGLPCATVIANEIEYIRKEALMEWLDGKMTIEGASEGFVGGYDSALKDVIEHINSM